MNFTALNTLPTFLRMLNPIFGNASNNRYSSDYYKNNEKQEKLDKVIDELKNKYGYNKITRAGKMNAGDILELKDIKK